MDFFRSPAQRRKHDQEKALHHLERQYNGGHGWSDGDRYRRPLAANKNDDRRRLGEYYVDQGDEEHGRQTFLNPDFENVRKYADLDTYYSDTKVKPRRLVVQATPDVIRQDRQDPANDTYRNWGRRKLRARVPAIIKLAELCLNPLGDSHYDGTEMEEKYDHDREKRSTSKKDLPVWKVILHWTLSTTFTICFAWILLVMMSLQLIAAPWSSADTSETYDGYGNVDWHWPKHALNPLDQSPDNSTVQAGEEYLKLPRKLVVRDEKEPGKWVTKATKDVRHPLTGELAPYIFLSYASASFRHLDDKQRHEYLHHVAERMIDRENRQLGDGESEIQAFWLDEDCISEDNKMEKDKDVYSISDAVRSAHRVYIVLQDGTASAKRTFGQRVWTLPEALLGAGKTRVCFPHPSVEGDFELHDTSLTDMYGSFWCAHQQQPQSGDVVDGKNGAIEWAGIKQDEPMSMLIKHYSSTLKLSDLQLFSYAVQALADGITSRDGPGSAISVRGYTNSYLAYAAMGLLSYRINPIKLNEPENNFQAIARLSLVNDTDGLLERLVCMWPRDVRESYSAEFPNAAAGTNKILGNIAKRDQYRTHLWDIKPICQVVGVGDDPDTPTVILDRCHAIPIRWKSFPSLRYSKNFKGLRNTLALNVVYYGCLMLNIGFWSLWQAIPVSFGISFGGSSGNSTSSGESVEITEYSTGDFISWYLAGAAILFALAWVASLFSPLAVRQLCNGDGGGNSNHLVGFEGTMDLRDIEIAMYGNFNNRLRYAPSSTLFSDKLRRIQTRTAHEPQAQDWDEIHRHVPPGHRLFTIIDTGDCTVSLIATERPPVVALVCGREGGMARALLCSWRFDNNCLYREYVMRMRSSVVDLSPRNDWLKVSLASQGDVNRLRLERPKKKAAAKAPSLLSSGNSLGKSATPTSVD
jgi:hypothetical protein